MALSRPARHSPLPSCDVYTGWRKKSANQPDVLKPGSGIAFFVNLKSVKEPRTVLLLVGIEYSMCDLNL